MFVNNWRIRGAHHLDKDEILLVSNLYGGGGIKLERENIERPPRILRNGNFIIRIKNVSKEDLDYIKKWMAPVMGRVSHHGDFVMMQHPTCYIRINNVIFRIDCTVRMECLPNGSIDMFVYSVEFKTWSGGLGLIEHEC